MPDFVIGGNAYIPESPSSIFTGKHRKTVTFFAVILFVVSIVSTYFIAERFATTTSFSGAGPLMIRNSPDSFWEPIVLLGVLTPFIAYSYYIGSFTNFGSLANRLLLLMMVPLASYFIFSAMHDVSIDSGQGVEGWAESRYGIDIDMTKNPEIKRIEIVDNDKEKLSGYILENGNIVVESDTYTGITLLSYPEMKELEVIYR